MQEKFTMETLTEGFLKGFVSGQITEAKKYIWITADSDLQFEIKIMELGARIEFTWVIGAHRVNPNPNQIMEDIEYVTEEDYVPIVKGDTYEEVSGAISKILGRVELTQWKGILEDVRIRD